MPGTPQGANLGAALSPFILTAQHPKPEAWILPPLNSPWINANTTSMGFTSGPPGYMLDDYGVVHFCGGVSTNDNGTTTQSVVWTLPPGYRPPGVSQLPSMMLSAKGFAQGYCQIDPDGIVHVYNTGGSSGPIHELDNIRFSIV